MLEASVVLRENVVQVEPRFEAQLNELLGTCRQNLPFADEDMIRRAFNLSYWAHRNDRRASGEWYITHPLAVAMIMAREIRLDDISVGAALLHDVVEDTELSLEIIRAEFGDTMAMLIDGLTKIRGVYSNRQLGQAENVRKLILSMARDIRVILVKFADRLHNMQTINPLPRTKQLRVASETRNLFAPLAHRFGLQKVKNELEDLSLEILEPEAYYEIVQGLKASRQERDNYVKGFIGPLKVRLKEEGFDFDIYGRSKNIHSIFQKMKKQNKPLEEIYDVFAIRIVLQSEGRKGKEDCWRVYSIITDLYRPLPERFRDFISMAKSNGYQSLHTTVLGRDGRRIEVQIRTQEMHEIAERGVAAHWKYKEGIETADAHMDQFLTWVHDLMENPDAEEATEFVQEFTLDLYSDEIYVFTPKGDLKTLPQNATPVDFAFKVHTDVGYQCIGAKVNGKMVPLSYKLKSGDQVQIITSKKKTPNPDWVKFVVTHKAKSRIRHWINEERRTAIRYGRNLWRKKAKRARIVLSDEELARMSARFKYSSPNQMFYEIASGLFDLNELVQMIRSGSEEKIDDGESATEFDDFRETAQQSGQEALLIDGEFIDGMALSYATCCNPIPGDAIFGLISKLGAIRIHRTVCRNAPDLLVNHAERIQRCDWSRQKNVEFMVGLRLVGEDRVGIVHDITTVISRNLKVNIRSITVGTNDGLFEGTIVLYVSDLQHLRRLMKRLRRVESIRGVYRFESDAVGAK
ncbi:MAG: bifunctional (p)ppGpp synthetase/guanosine-3',5'-bis(diphosphate) 3'-pyrophosphohydrolase [Bacteroidota bacterium]|nr:bifunctional (p)ppGpp synthetase/guanosine-3',5'-bis(diphosphate) 3'-pyrophosphohydrolase [Bacteroidota bacterium]MDE2956529.1 bifunctional (p)ppGpp synthetase/guanosine-3',5'-bis(diphosphate) 3'-pyrophosphohydrolase [Bacteroidota bacterium]